MLNTVLIILAICLISCTHSTMNPAKQQLDASMKQIDASFEHEGMKLIGTGEGYSQNISMVCRSYATKGIKLDSVESARIYAVNFTNKFLETINNDSALSPFLANSDLRDNHRGYLTPDNLMLSVYFTEDYSLPYKQPLICQVSCLFGELRYYYLDSSTDKPELFHQELWSQAIEQIKQQQNSKNEPIATEPSHEE